MSDPIHQEVLRCSGSWHLHSKELSCKKISQSCWEMRGQAGDYSAGTEANTQLQLLHLRRLFYTLGKLVLTPWSRYTTHCLLVFVGFFVLVCICAAPEELSNCNKQGSSESLVSVVTLIFFFCRRSLWLKIVFNPLDSLIFMQQYVTCVCIDFQAYVSFFCFPALTMLFLFTHLTR